MAIPASHIVEIQPRIIRGGSPDLELNGLLLTDNDLISATTMVLEFPSAVSVADYFGPQSVEHLAAEVYFTSYNNKIISPRALYVARRVATDAPAWLRGGRLDVSLARLQTVGDGSLALSVNNTAVSVVGIDFTHATSLSEMAQTLEGYLNTALNTTGEENAPPQVGVSYSSLTGAFTVTSRVPGAVGEVGYACETGIGTDLGLLLNFVDNKGAVLSQGMNALNVDEQMAKIRARTENFVCFTTAWEEDADAMLLWAEWANRHYGWLYMAYSTNPAIAVADSDFDPASLLKKAGYDHCSIIYGSLEYAAFMMGVVASIAWQRVNGTITAAFKRQSGLAPWVVDEAAATVLESKNCNYFGNFATRNAEFVFLYPGCLSQSTYGYLDPYVNSVWLNNRLQVALMDGISSAGRVPYNTRGYTMIKAWMMDPLNTARNNGVIEAGVALSERQRTEVMNEAGLDISKELWTQGYYIQVLDPGADVRARRGSPLISLWYTHGGAVQKIEVASSAIL